MPETKSPLLPLTTPVPPVSLSDRLSPRDRQGVTSGDAERGSRGKTQGRTRGNTVSELGLSCPHCHGRTMEYIDEGWQPVMIMCAGCNRLIPFAAWRVWWYYPHYHLAN